jgi:hypothetical protein
MTRAQSVDLRRAGHDLAHLVDRGWAMQPHRLIGGSYSTGFARAPPVVLIEVSDYSSADASGSRT